MTLPSNDLREGDVNIIDRFVDVLPYEPEQILPLVVPPAEEKATTAKRIEEIQGAARSLIEKINQVEGMLDERCAHFKVVGDGGKGSKIYQAMVRVFNERTTTVTYSHYARAIEMRQGIMKKKAEEIRRT